MQPRHLKLAREAGIEFPTVLPLFDAQPNPRATQAWIENHRAVPEIHMLAQKIASHIQYISFEVFLLQLKKTIADFNQQVTAPYVLWITHGKLASKGKSDLWVAGLALEYCNLRWPEAIVFNNNLRSYLAGNPEIQDILILDDALYSGTQIKQGLVDIDTQVFSDIYTTKREIQSFIEDYKHKVYLAVPFATNKINKISGRFLSNISILKHENIPFIKDQLEQKEIDTLADFPYLQSLLGMRTLCYFNHKFPDNLSTLPELIEGTHLSYNGSLITWMKKLNCTYKKEEFKEGMTLRESPEEWNALVTQLTPKSERLVPVIVPPYKLTEEKSIAELKALLQTNQIPKRTPYPLPSRLQSIHEMLNQHGLPAELTNASVNFEFLAEQKSTSSSLTSEKPKNTSTLLSLLIFCRRPYLVGFSLTLLAGILATRYGMNNNPLDIAVLPEPQPIPTGIICQHAEFIANQFPGKGSMMVAEEKLVAPLDQWSDKEIIHHEKNMRNNIAYHVVTGGMIREQSNSYHKDLRWSFFKNDYSDFSPSEKRALYWIQEAFTDTEAVIRTGSYMCRTGINFSVAKALALFALKNYEFPQVMFQILIRPANDLPDEFKEPVVENKKLIYAGHVTLLMSQPEQKIPGDLLQELDSELSHCDVDYFGGDLALSCNRLTARMKELLSKMNLATCDAWAGDTSSELNRAWSQNSGHFLNLCQNPAYRCMALMFREEYLTPRIKQYLLKAIEEKSELWERVVKSTAKTQALKP